MVGLSTPRLQLTGSEGERGERLCCWCCCLLWAKVISQVWRGGHTHRFDETHNQPSVRRGMIRYLLLVLDLSEAMNMLGDGKCSRRLSLLDVAQVGAAVCVLCEPVLPCVY